MRPTAIGPLLWMTLGALLFASMTAMTHALGDKCDWLLIALFRAIVMFSVAVGMARSRGVPLAFREPPTLWLRSLAGSVSLVCNFYAMTRLPVAEVLTLMNMYPLWILLLTNLIGRKLPGITEVLGVGCGLLGVVLIERPDLGGVRLASGVALIGSLSTSVAMLGLHRLRGVDPRAIVAHFAGVAATVAAIWMILRGGFTSNTLPDTGGWALLLGVAFSGTFAQFCLTKAYASGSPTQVSMVGLIQVVFALGFDVMIWGRSIAPSAAVGFLLILAPTAWLAARAGQRLARTRRREADESRRATETFEPVLRVPEPVSCRAEG